MRYASVDLNGRPHAVLIDGERAIPLAGIDELGGATPLELLRAPTVDEAGAFALSEATLRPVVPRPGKILCLGLNYRAHVRESERELPTYPVLFAKFASALVAAGEPIVKPPESHQVDYEGELAIVVGRAIRRASPAEAIAAIAGYTVANDITMRDYQYKSHQWLPGKAWERSTPLGPHLVTPDEVGDPHTLDLALQLNGATMQAANTAQLIFDVPTILSTISEFTTLEPGDVVLTGTPGGVGYRRDPQVLLQAGDLVRVEIERVGVLENHVVAEDVGA